MRGKKPQHTLTFSVTLRCLIGKKSLWVRCSFLCVNISLARPLLSSLKMVVFVGKADSFSIPSDSLISSTAHCHSL